MTTNIKPTPLKFAVKTKKLSINDFQEYQKLLQDKEQLKELIKKFSLQNILDLMTAAASADGEREQTGCRPGRRQRRQTGAAADNRAQGAWRAGVEG